VNFLRDEKLDVYPLKVLFKKEFKSLVFSPLFPLLLVVTTVASSLSLLRGMIYRIREEED